MNNPYSELPSVDHMLQQDAFRKLINDYGRTLVVKAVRNVLASVRKEIASNPSMKWNEKSISDACVTSILNECTSSIGPVFNLTGTVIHTNLGRSLLAEDAIHAVLEAMRHPLNLEFDLKTGKRGDRDDHLAPLLREITGAEDATVVNNNAAAVFLLLNTLARRKEVIVSRGELIEIGGAFRIPDIMSDSGARLREVGTTNRTHRRDYEDAIGTKTALIMKVHRSNFSIEGFTASVEAKDLADLAHQNNLFYVEDLGSGTLVDLSKFGLPKEPTPMDAIRDGADLVTFSGDKLMGGPQAGIIVGRADLVKKLKRNPLKRVLRVDKMTLVALVATLQLFKKPEMLPQKLTTLRLLTRKEEQVRAICEDLQGSLTTALASCRASVSVEPCQSQIGSGSLPVSLLPSYRLAVRPGGKTTGRDLNRLAKAFLSLPIPVIGRIDNNALCFDCRCLEQVDEFRAQLIHLLP